MNNKKVIRRSIMVTIICILATSSLVLHSLKSKNEGNLPSAGSKTGTTTIKETVTIRSAGVEVGPIELPKTEIRSPEDRKRYNKLAREIIRKRVDSDPRMAEAKEKAWKRDYEKGLKKDFHNRVKSMKIYEEKKLRQMEEKAKKQLEEVVNSSLSEEEKKKKRDHIQKMLDLGKKALKRR
jgi:hypothetical protein